MPGTGNLKFRIFYELETDVTNAYKSDYLGVYEWFEFETEALARYMYLLNGTCDGESGRDTRVRPYTLCLDKIVEFRPILPTRKGEKHVAGPA